MQSHNNERRSRRHIFVKASSPTPPHHGATACAMLLVALGILSGDEGEFKKAAAPLDVLVVAPHPDDEALGCAGVIMQAIENKKRVGIVLVTNGDGFPKAASVTAKKPVEKLVAADFLQLASIRQQHSVGAMSRIGVRAGDLMFLGYPDSALKPLYEGKDDTLVQQKYTERNSTYGALIRDYHTLRHGRPASYVKASITNDIAEIIESRKPREIYVTNEADVHPDHKATFWFVRDAAKAAGYRGSLFTYVIHGAAPADAGHRVALSKAEQARKRALIEEYQQKLSPIHDDLAEKFTHPEEVFWLVPVE